MGLGPIAGIHGITLPTTRKVEPPAPRFDIEPSERAGDEPTSRQQQQASAQKRKDEEPEDLFQATREGDDEEAGVGVVSQISDEGHDWFV